MQRPGHDGRRTAGPAVCAASRELDRFYAGPQLARQYVEQVAVRYGGGVRYVESLARAFVRQRPITGVRVMAFDIDPRGADAEFAARRGGLDAGGIHRRGEAGRAGLSALTHYLMRAVRPDAAASVRSISGREVVCAFARAAG